MKRFALFIAGLLTVASFALTASAEIPFGASSAKDAENGALCLSIARVAAMAAGARDNQRSPQQAYEIVKESGYEGVGSKSFTGDAGLPADQIKHLINAVYFDPDMSSIPSDLMADEVFDACTHPDKPKYEPLK